MDDEFKRGISVYFNWNEFFVDQYLARITRTMDEKKTSREKKLEMERISAKTICEFSEKSHRKLVRFGQQNRNAELKLTKFGTTETIFLSYFVRTYAVGRSE
jgi:endonuclease III